VVVATNAKPISGCKLAGRQPPIVRFYRFLLTSATTRARTLGPSFGHASMTAWSASSEIAPLFAPPAAPMALFPGVFDGCSTPLGGISRFFYGYNRSKAEPAGDNPMAMTKDQILTEAMSLDEREREEVAEALRQIAAPEEFTPDQLAEVRDRIVASDNGQVQAIPGEQVMQELRQRFRR
jgi:hypothetical protein